MVITTFVASTKAKASEVNTNFAHNFTYGTAATLAYTAGSGSTHHFIIVKGYITATGNGISSQVTLTSDVDGALDNVIIWESSSSSENRAQPFTLIYAGTMTIGAHTLTVAADGGASLNSIKIVAMEFLLRTSIFDLFIQ